jgi:hypothetical protein
MVAPEISGIDLFKIAGRSTSGWVKSISMGNEAAPVKQPFCTNVPLNYQRLVMREGNWKVVGGERT